MLGGIFNVKQLKQKIENLGEKTNDPGFWNMRDSAERVMTEIKQSRTVLETWQELTAEIDELYEFYDLAREENDESLSDEIRIGLENIRKKYSKQRILELFSEKHDIADCYLTIHSGAGGTEACDWVSMLLRMYIRWIERQGFKSKILDIQEAEGGIKSVALLVEASHAYGYLKGETGVHRLVRISPFDSSGRRHTSFASVYISPALEESINITIKQEEIRIDTFRASGAGGQHVNTTDSAVRISHLATGIVVQCQNERSQHKNKERAMKMLSSRLYDYYRAQQEAEKKENTVEKMDIGWGSQIRSYVFQPYTMVKDLRTRTETGNIQAVMDGNLDSFIESYLQMIWNSQNEIPK